MAAQHEAPQYLMQLTVLAFIGAMLLVIRPKLLVIRPK